MINPQNRPTAETLLKHRLFRGSEEFKVKNKDIWQVKAPPNKIIFLSSLFIARAAALRLPPNPSDSLQINEEYKNVTNIQEPKANEIDRKHDRLQIDTDNQSLKLNNADDKDIREASAQLKIGETKSNKTDSKKFDEVFDRLQIDTDNQALANDPEPELSKMHRTDVSEVFDQEKIDSNNQKPELNSVDNKDYNKISDLSKIDSNNQEAKPNYIKHDHNVALTKRQSILEWGRRTKSRVTKTFNRLLRRPKKNFTTITLVTILKIK